MAHQKSNDQERRDRPQDAGLSGSELQRSQSGGGSGEYGGNRDQQQGENPSTRSYGTTDNKQQNRGQSQTGYGSGQEGGEGQSRGESFDEPQGGGRGVSEWDNQQGVSGEGNQQGETSEFGEDQRAHQDQGQSDIERDEP